MNKYIDSEKLIAEIERRKKQDVTFRERSILIDIETAITSLQQEQPEVDLEKEFNDFLDNMEGMPRMWHSDAQIEWGKHIARHFYGLRNRAIEEAARHVYESWMGGTMHDVRRDMVELGNVLNAKKEE